MEKTVGDSLRTMTEILNDPSTWVGVLNSLATAVLVGWVVFGVVYWIGHKRGWL